MAPKQFRTYIDPRTKVLDESALIDARDFFHSQRRAAENAGGTLPLPWYRKDFPTVLISNPNSLLV